MRDQSRFQRLCTKGAKDLTSTLPHIVPFLDTSTTHDTGLSLSFTRKGGLSSTLPLDEPITTLGPQSAGGDRVHNSWNRSLSLFQTKGDLTSTLPHDEAITALVPGSAGGGGVAIAFAERFARYEPANAAGDDGRLCAPRQHQVRVTALDVLSSTAVQQSKTISHSEYAASLLSSQRVSCRHADPAVYTGSLLSILRVCCLHIGPAVYTAGLCDAR